MTELRIKSYIATVWKGAQGIKQATYLTLPLLGTLVRIPPPPQLDLHTLKFKKLSFTIIIFFKLIINQSRIYQFLIAINLSYTEII